MSITKSGMVALSAFVILSACKKNEDASRRDMLIGSWLTTSVAVDNNNNGVPDPNETFELDSSSAAFYKFTSDGQVLITDYHQEHPFQGQWTLENGGTDIKIVENASGSPFWYHISSIAAHDMTLSLKDASDMTKLDFITFKK